MKTRVRNHKAFTIVELAIVIAVIGILIVIGLVSYRGVQDRARDASRRNDLSILTKAIQQYRIERGNYATDNCGEAGSSYPGSGWITFNGNVGGRLSTYDCLINGDFLDKKLQDPSGMDYCTVADGKCDAYIRISCVGASPKGQWIGARLSSLPPSTTATDETCRNTIDTSFGVNYLVKID